ncbi:hypothetical protein [Fusobacterium sp. HMSC073F01]|uniref:hypothetical protein n=1 Tax=Fusobacterium sp. HMSC073F01 TaxID=1739251 RepID=UPI0008A4999A|nr:hypothetical protein [Fusobacterium sp. HMSC073F01]OFL94142.1 hypothetical protein HMPREF2747_16390 [Fusobacterium sp. HMSC073F01]
MKKYLLLGILAISSISFAWGRHYDNYGSYGYIRNCCSSYNYHRNSYRENTRLTSAQQKTIDNYQLQIDEKRLEINKIINSDNVNWNEIEKLNKEIAEIKAEIRTEFMKSEYSAK